MLARFRVGMWICSFEKNPLKSLKFLDRRLAFDFLAISFASVLAFGGIWVLSSFFEDDDDQDGGGLGTPIIQPSYAQSST